MLTYLSMKIVTHIFGYKICSIPNISGFKIFNESIVLGFNLTLHMQAPPPWGNSLKASRIYTYIACIALKEALY